MKFSTFFTLAPGDSCNLARRAASRAFSFALFRPTSMGAAGFIIRPPAKTSPLDDLFVEAKLLYVIRSHICPF